MLSFDVSEILRMFAARGVCFAVAPLAQRGSSAVGAIDLARVAPVASTGGDGSGEAPSRATRGGLSWGEANAGIGACGGWRLPAPPSASRADCAAPMVPLCARGGLRRRHAARDLAGRPWHALPLWLLARRVFVSSLHFWQTAPERPPEQCFPILRSPYVGCGVHHLGRLLQALEQRLERLSLLLALRRHHIRLLRNGMHALVRCEALARELERRKR